MIIERRQIVTILKASFMRVGDTVRKPQRFYVHSGDTFDPQPIVPRVVTVIEIQGENAITRQTIETLYVNRVQRRFN